VNGRLRSICTVRPNGRALLKKKRRKLQQAEEARSKQVEIIEVRTRSKDDALYKARLVVYRNKKRNELKEKRANGIKKDENEEELS
jgi:hypothetical protein